VANGGREHIFFSFIFHTKMPRYWVLNPFHAKYKHFPKITVCVICHLGLPTKKNQHNIQTILNTV